MSSLFGRKAYSRAVFKLRGIVLLGIGVSLFCNQPGFGQVPANLTDVTASRIDFSQVFTLTQKLQTAQEEIAGYGQYSLIVLLMAVVAYQYWKLHRRNASLQMQVVQSQLMMKELHHRVKNNLAIVTGLLNLQSHNMQDQQAIAAIRQGQERIEAMSLIHQNLYLSENQTQVNIHEYLLNLTENLLRAHGYNPDRFDLRFDIAATSLDINMAVPIGLISNELITNALKYAYHYTENPVLRLSLRTEPSLVLEVADNGPGFDMANWQSTSGSFGKQLVKALGRQLGGQLNICFDNGTCVRLSLPVAA